MTKQELADRLGLPLYVVERWPEEHSGRTTIDGVEYATDSAEAQDAIRRAELACSADAEVAS